MGFKGAGECNCGKCPDCVIRANEYYGITRGEPDFNPMDVKVEKEIGEIFDRISAPNGVRFSRYESDIILALMPILARQEKWKQYAQHKESCGAPVAGANACNCGLTALRNALLAAQPGQKGERK